MCVPAMLQQQLHGPWCCHSCCCLTPPKCSCAAHSSGTSISPSSNCANQAQFRQPWSSGSSLHSLAHSILICQSHECAWVWY